MSVRRENIELYGPQDEAQIMEVLVDEFGAVEHPNQENAYILENQPFYTPRFAEDHISILSFNNTPLPDSLIEALVEHTELFPDDVLVRWTHEQDLILEATLGQLRARATP
jgi:hypothetical protein